MTPKELVMCTAGMRVGDTRCAARACITRKLAASRRLMWEGGRKPLSWPRRPRGARSCPTFSAMLRWNSQAADRDGW